MYFGSPYFGPLANRDYFGGPYFGAIPVPVSAYRPTGGAGWMPGVYDDVVPPYIRRKLIRDDKDLIEILTAIMRTIDN